MLMILYQIQNRSTNSFALAFTDKDVLTPNVRSMDGFVRFSKGILLSEEK